MKKAAAVEWRDFKKQSESDILACRLLYNASDYGNAAYHLQQAVEKHTKAILLAGNLLTGGKTHLPLSKFIDELLLAFFSLEQIVKSHSGRVVEDSGPTSRRSQFLVQSQVIIRKLAEKDKSFKMALWKNSLGISLLRDEEEVFRQCPEFRKYNKINLKETLLFSGDTKDRDNFWNEASSNPNMNNLYFYQPIAEIGSIIAATFPHEEIGRYPTEIDTVNGLENSVELYKKHKAELLKLIEKAEKYLAEG